jgi:hypothetical protein
MKWKIVTPKIFSARHRATKIIFSIILVRAKISSIRKVKIMPIHMKNLLIQCPFRKNNQLLSRATAILQLPWEVLKILSNRR